jgi:GAF domain-containing protein
VSEETRIDPEVSELVHRPSRLRALAALDANPETSAQALDRIAGIACRVLDVPVVLVNLVGAERQRFIGCGGPEPWSSMREMPLTAGFCPFALGADEAYALADARTDPALAANPAVERFGVVAYAGVPLRGADGEPVGTLCAIDHRPRTWSADDLGLLTDLAAEVIAELQLLAATRLVARDQARLRALAELSSALVPAETPDDVLEALAPALDRLDPTAVRLLPRDDAGREEPEFLTTRADVRGRFDRNADVVPDAGAAAVLPLRAGEGDIGALAVCFADERTFSADERAYLEAVGGVSGLALARAPR